MPRAILSVFGIRENSTQTQTEGVEAKKEREREREREAKHLVKQNVINLRKLKI